MNTRVLVRASVGVVSWALVVSSAFAQPCVPAWSDQFSLSDFDSWIWNLAVHDDGSGPAVYAAGFFTQAGNTPVRRLISLYDGVRLGGIDVFPVVPPVVFGGNFVCNPIVRDSRVAEGAREHIPLAQFKAHGGAFRIEGRPGDQMHHTAGRIRTVDGGRGTRDVRCRS